MKTGRYKTVEVRCEVCGTPFQALEVRVKKGQGRFCSLEHANVWQREERKSTKHGKENAKTYPKTGGGFFVQWYEEGKAKNSPWHRWAWEMAYGEIPEGHAVEYKDGNKENITLENLQLRRTRQGKKLLPKQKRTVSLQGRLKMSEILKQRWANGGFAGVIFKDISKENNPKWRGGVENKYSYEFRQICPFIKSRDNHKCQICSKDVYRSKYGHVHHRDGNTENNDQNNLLLLCASCHARVHSSKMESPPIMALRAELHWNQ